MLRNNTQPQACLLAGFCLIGRILRAVYIATVYAAAWAVVESYGCFLQNYLMHL